MILIYLIIKSIKSYIRVPREVNILKISKNNISTKFNKNV